MTLKSPLARVLGLGSAKDGVAHWWSQRLTSIALIPLGLWFVYSIVGLLPSGHAATVEWLHSPLQAGLFILFILVVFWHAFLGLQVVVEDYVHTEWLKVTLLIALKMILALLGTISSLMVLQISLGS